MDIEKLAKNAIKKIKERYDLPSSGLLAGGSIANLIWEEISGVKAVINDIDIFLLNEIRDSKNKEKNSHFLYNTIGKKLIRFDNYQGLRFMNTNSDFYSITSSTTDSMINRIEYDSNTNDRNIIIQSFDLNCVMIGYLIEEDRILFTKEFEEFLINKTIKIVNATTPCHTAIRLVKKCDELGLKIDERELEILGYIIYLPAYNDIIKFNFMEKYYDLFIKYREVLHMFDIKEIQTVIVPSLESVTSTSPCLKSVNDNLTTNEINEDNKLWTLASKEKKSIYDLGFSGSGTNTSEIITYFRNIEKNDEFLNFKNYAWLKINDMNDSDDYLEGSNRSDVDYLYNIYIHFQEIILKLRGFKLIEQVNLLKNLFNLYDNKAIPLALITTDKVNCNTILPESDMDLILLELSVRRLVAKVDFNHTVDNGFKRIMEIEQNKIKELC